MRVGLAADEPAGALTATASTLAGSRLVGRISPRLLLPAGLALMLVAGFTALFLTLAGQLNRFWALSLLGLAFVGSARSAPPPPASHWSAYHRRRARARRCWARCRTPSARPWPP
ncbi:hypothetical protein [Nonomuraea sp. NPDC049309]|uniref:hypothetical protein n=1 Tax=Nonomuraea sp. NPDC049309 TaxID=3364350 RepID=UPI00371950C0